MESALVLEEHLVTIALVPQQKTRNYST